MNSAAGVVHAAMQSRQTAAGIAAALEAACLLQSPESAAEQLERATALADTLDALLAVTTERDALRARVAELEVERPIDDERLALIRRRRTHCEATRYERDDERPLHEWGPSQHPRREMCQRCTVLREWAEDADADEVVLLGEVDRLRARIAELEAGDGRTRTVDEDPIAYVLTDEATALGAAEASERLRALLAPATGPLPAEVLAERLPSREDGFRSPLHTDYRLPHDLPEVTP
ncbi:hypothetical protein [Streptomyces sp. DH12]|uniref:hypothetical protein n=1 Tax=Streptomyces sp. DH12 TaxID=2857010 RepID=UPI001E471128|nr:hypothetical protein [Streptomyces sp. DH12]